MEKRTIQMFGFSKEQMEKLTEWQKHTCKMKDGCGAIGGRFTYSFTPTGLGTVTIAKCACGKEINLTDVDGW